MANRFSTGSNIIQITRGDTLQFNVSIEDEAYEGQQYILANTDIAYLGVMLPHQKFEDAIIKKKFTFEDQDPSGNITVIIEPEDTVDLDPGVYYYAVKLQRTTTVTTVINKTKFVILD